MRSPSDRPPGSLSARPDAPRFGGGVAVEKGVRRRRRGLVSGGEGRIEPEVRRIRAYCAQTVAWRAMPSPRSVAERCLGITVGHGHAGQSRCDEPTTGCHHPVGPWSLGTPSGARHDRLMSETRSPSEPEQVPPAQADAGEQPAADSADAVTGPRASVEPLRLPPLLPRRQNPWLVVEVDGSPATHGALVWALREAARREATVVAVCVVDAPDGDPLGGADRDLLRAQLAVHDRLEAQVLRAIAETGVHGRSHTAVLASAGLRRTDRRLPRRRPRVRGGRRQDTAPPGSPPYPDPPPRPRRLTRHPPPVPATDPLRDRFPIPAGPPTVGPCPRPTHREPSEPVTAPSRRC